MTEMVLTTINGRWDLWLPAPRAARPEWSSAAGWERARLDAMCERIGPGDVVYYIGSEVGEMPALCSLWGASTVIVEPNGAVWPSIKAIWEANGLKPPLGMYAGFCSDITDESPPEPAFDIAMRDGWPACAYGEVIGDHGFRSLADQFHTSPQIRLDDLVDRVGRSPTVISFDVEGSEWKVLRGAERTLREYRPILFASIHPEFLVLQYGEYSVDLRNWIKGFGYRETYLDYFHELHLLYERED